MCRWNEFLKALCNVLQGMLLGVMFLGQMQDGWVYHPYRVPITGLVIFTIVLRNWPKKMGT